MNTRHSFCQTVGKILGHIALLLALLYAGLGVNLQEAIASQVPVPALKLRVDGFLRLYSYHLDEFLEVQYKDPFGAWNVAAYEKIKKTCRSRDEHEKFAVDRRLIELADHLQDHFGADVIEIISCYRSSAFNKKLKTEGHSVASESFHTKGLAMDIHIDEIRESTLRNYLVKLGLGGVGYYGNRLMVHMDFGPVRQWTDGEWRNNTTIGLFNKASAWQLKTDKLFYTSGEDIQVTITGADEGSFPVVFVEKFVRGKWVQVNQLTLKRVHPHKRFPSVIRGDDLLVQTKRILDDGTEATPFGKYRLRFEHNGDWQNSNEFYIKKQ